MASRVIRLWDSEGLSVTTHRRALSVGAYRTLAHQWRLASTAGVASGITVYEGVAPVDLLFADLNPATNPLWKVSADLAFVALPNNANAASEIDSVVNNFRTALMYEVVVTPTALESFSLFVHGRET